MDTRTHDKIIKEKVAPQPALDSDKESPDTEIDVFAWSSRRPQDAAPFVLTDEEDDDEPAPDVGGEVGKTPRLLTAWQITGLVLAGMAIAAGVAGAIYLTRARD